LDNGWKSETDFFVILDKLFYYVFFVKRFQPRGHFKRTHGKRGMTIPTLDLVIIIGYLLGIMGIGI